MDLIHSAEWFVFDIDWYFFGESSHRGSFEVQVAAMPADLPVLGARGLQRKETSTFNG